MHLISLTHWVRIHTSDRLLGWQFSILLYWVGKGWPLLKVLFLNIIATLKRIAEENNILNAILLPALEFKAIY